MKCPACDGALTEMDVGTVRVDACRGGCGGIWFDARELRKVDDAAEREGEALLGIPRDPSRPLLAGRRHCTRCAEAYPLMSLPFGPGAVDVRIDECPGCGGRWLDAGELERIRARSSARHAQPNTAAVAALLATERVRSENEREYSFLGFLRWLHGK
jgi:hypothetical protein